ncbi:hypothetical protein [Ktedonobacter racemifer]|uniref:Uncharacterized protein n=1 Tax=Ktedonobacter racemifer DSM 44963 TaxID=485913 RepID=D6TJ61_KTERA|nr:hypothetical protein [Ktedonobacter racemifer]EFH89468.1 hypothetical protein Krac_11026 [Ktedonobacter racemifer DSM 44963]
MKGREGGEDCATVLRHLDKYGQATFTRIGSCFTEGSFTEPSHDGSARAALSDRRFTLPEELPVGTWLAAQIQDRQRCQVQRGIEVTIDHQPTGRMLADIDAL